MTNMLIIDYDVTRYHSLDIFQILLSDKELFRKCSLDYLRPFVSATIRERIVYHAKNMIHFNPYELFGISDMKAVDLDLRIAETLQRKDIPTTSSDMHHRFGIILRRRDVTCSIIRYTQDPWKSDLDTLANKVYTTDTLLDLRMIMALIVHKDINLILVSSVDVAILIASRMLSMEIHVPVKFMIASYRYNYDDNGVIKHIHTMNKLEYSRKFEFGLFDPFTGLNSVPGGSTI